MKFELITPIKKPEEEAPIESTPEKANNGDMNDTMEVPETPAVNLAETRLSNNVHTEQDSTPNGKDKEEDEKEVSAVPESPEPEPPENGGNDTSVNESVNNTTLEQPSLNDSSFLAPTQPPAPSISK